MSKDEIIQKMTGEINAMQALIAFIYHSDDPCVTEDARLCQRISDTIKNKDLNIHELIRYRNHLAALRLKFYREIMR